MFIFEITGPRTQRPEGPQEPRRIVNNNDDQSPRGHSSGNDGFNERGGFSYLRDVIPGDSGSASLSTYERGMLEAINRACERGQVSENTAIFVRKLIFNPEFRSAIVARYWGQEVADSLAERRKNGDKRAQQVEMLAALVAIPEPTQIISAINAIKGELLDELKGMAAGMLANARDLAEWFAHTRARRGDTRDAYALAQAEGRSAPDIVGSMITFLSDPTLSYNPSQILADAQITARRVNRNSAAQREIRTLEYMVANADPNNLTPAQRNAARRLPDLRNSITSA